MFGGCVGWFAWFDVFESEMYDFEPTLQRFEVFMVWKTFLDGVVAGDDDFFGSDEVLVSSFDFAFKRVSVAPTFEEVCHVFALLGISFFNHYDIFVVVSVPPFVDLLVVVFWVGRPYLV